MNAVNKIPLRSENKYLTAGGSGDECPCFISNYSYTTQRKCMRVGVQRQQTVLVTTERAFWRYDNAFLFTNQSEVDFGVAHVYSNRQLLRHSIARSQCYSAYTASCVIARYLPSYEAPSYSKSRYKNMVITIKCGPSFSLIS